MSNKTYLRERFFPHLWCPGCGHYAVLNAITKALAHLANLFNSSATLLRSGPLYGGMVLSICAAFSTICFRLGRVRHLVGQPGLDGLGCPVLLPLQQHLHQRLLVRLRVGHLDGGLASGFPRRDDERLEQYRRMRDELQRRVGRADQAVHEGVVHT